MESKQTKNQLPCIINSLYNPPNISVNRQQHFTDGEVEVGEIAQFLQGNMVTEGCEDQPV